RTSCSGADPARAIPRVAVGIATVRSRSRRLRTYAHAPPTPLETLPMDRRHFLGAGIAGASVLTFSSVLSQSAPNPGAPTLPEPGFRKMTLGSMEVYAINDGALRRPLGDEFVRNAPLEQV